MIHLPYFFLKKLQNVVILVSPTHQYSTTHLGINGINEYECNVNFLLKLAETKAEFCRNMLQFFM